MTSQIIAEQISSKIETSLKSISEQFGVDNQLLIGVLENYLSVPVGSKKQSLLKLHRGGVGGGKTTKFSNAFVNIKQLLVFSAESIISIVGAAAFPILIPLALLVSINSFYSAFNIEIQELHALTLWSMWQNVGDNGTASFSMISTAVQPTLAFLGRSMVSDDVLLGILNDLESIHCVRKLPGNNWQLLETVHIVF